MLFFSFSPLAGLSIVVMDLHVRRQVYMDEELLGNILPWLRVKEENWKGEKKYAFSSFSLLSL